jgi:hypothetical protein
MPKITGTPRAYSVTFCRTEVLEFRDRWPCSGLPDCAITFEFDAAGDLVDVSTDYDGRDILALSQDASNFAASHFELPYLAR